MRCACVVMVAMTAVAVASAQSPADSELSDREVLKALYGATSGTSWTNSENWTSDLPLDEWYGVEADADDRVTRLDLGDNALSGDIGSIPQLVLLDDLRWADFSYNWGLTGEFPTPAQPALARLDLMVTQVCAPPELWRPGAVFDVRLCDELDPATVDVAVLYSSGIPSFYNMNRIRNKSFRKIERIAF